MFKRNCVNHCLDVLSCLAVSVCADIARRDSSDMCVLSVLSVCSTCQNSSVHDVHVFKTHFCEIVGPAALAYLGLW